MDYINNRREFLKFSGMTLGLCATGCSKADAANSYKSKPETGPCLVENSQGKATIIIAENCAEPERFAAQQLREYIKKISGANVAIKDDSHKVDGTLILVGKSKFTTGLLTDFRAADIWDDRFRIVTKPDRLSLVGASPRGTLFSVYHFLELLGCRWFEPGPGGDFVPTAGDIQLDKLNVEEKADLPRRSYMIAPAHYTPTECVDYVDWMTKNKINVFWWSGGVFEKNNKLDLNDWFNNKKETVLPEVLKRGLVVDFSDHNFQFMNGKICFADPQSVKRAVDYISNLLRDNPYIDCISLWPSDGWNGQMCACEKCLKLDKPLHYVEGEPHIVQRVIQTNGYLHFADAVTKSIRKKFPDKIVSLLAYNRLKQPPTDPNLQLDSHADICLAARQGQSGCYKHPLGSQCSKKQNTGEIIEEWVKKCKRVFLYEYYMKYDSRDLPYEFGPNIIADCKYLKSIGAMGIATQSSSQHWGPMGLNYYTLARAMWNSDTDWDDLIFDFCHKYYGDRAADSMIKYHQRLFTAVMESADHFVPSRKQIINALTPEHLKQCRKYINTANSKATTEIHKQRIDLRSRSLRYAELYIGGIVNGDKQQLKALARFLKWQSYGVVDQYNINGSVMGHNLIKTIRMKLDLDDFSKIDLSGY
jgi:hypothetical protein